MIDPTIDPTKDPVLRVLLPPLEEEADEPEADDVEVCVADFWAAFPVVVGVELPASAPVFVEGEFVVSVGNEYVVAADTPAVMELKIDDKEPFPC